MESNETTSSAPDERRTEILGAIAKYKTVVELTDEKLGEWMTFQHKAQQAQRTYAKLPGRFKRMALKGAVVLSSEIKPDGPLIQRFREGLKRQIADWERELSHSPTPAANQSPTPQKTQ